MDENVVDFEDYNVSIDLREIEKMSKEEIQECKRIIKEIQEKIEE